MNGCKPPLGGYRTRLIGQLAFFSLASSRQRRPLFQSSGDQVKIMGRSGSGARDEREMNEQRMRKIAEQAFKRWFPDVKLARVNAWPAAACKT